MAATFINPDFLRYAAAARGIKNAFQLSEKTGVPYPTCKAIFRDRMVMNAQLETVTRFCEVLSVNQTQLLTYSADLNYGDVIELADTSVAGG